nr:hypothetical protein GCM10020092_020890 [Actinoplanes digitatis]
MIYQLGALDGLARAAGDRVLYVKPHGALYNAIVHHEGQAAAVIDAVRRYDPDLPVLGLPGSVFLRLAHEAGLRVVREAFADRGYRPDGTLVPRREPGALLHDPAEVAERMLRLVTDHTLVAVDGSVIKIEADSICVHGDSPGAVEMARAVHDALAGSRRGDRRLRGRGVMRFLRCGREAVLVEVDDLPAALSLYAALRSASLHGVVDLVPAARTVLIHLDPAVTSPAAVERATAGLPVGGADPAGAGTVEIPVRYDGPDLDDVAEHTGLTREAVVALHTGSAWTVAFAGFAPGFGYLTGGDPRLDVPRRDSPRTRIPAGSVGLAEPVLRRLPERQPRRLAVDRQHHRAHVGPRPPGAGPAHTRRQGDVQGGAVSNLPRGLGPEVSAPPTAAGSCRPGHVEKGSAMTVTVLRPGPLTVLKDRGRAGHAGQGVAPSGAVDRSARARANALVGNSPDAAVLECTLGGLRVRFDSLGHRRADRHRRRPLGRRRPRGGSRRSSRCRTAPRSP